MAGQAKPTIDDPTKVHPLRQHRRRQQARIRHQIPLIEGRGNTTQIVVGSHSAGALPLGDQ
jgi:hypothetical protein